MSLSTTINRDAAGDSGLFRMGIGAGRRGDRDGTPPAGYIFLRGQTAPSSYVTLRGQTSTGVYVNLLGKVA